MNTAASPAATGISGNPLRGFSRAPAKGIHRLAFEFNGHGQIGIDAQALTGIIVEYFRGTIKVKMAPGRASSDVALSQAARTLLTHASEADISCEVWQWGHHTEILRRCDCILASVSVSAMIAVTTSPCDSLHRYLITPITPTHEDPSRGTGRAMPRTIAASSAVRSWASFSAAASNSAR